MFTRLQSHIISALAVDETDFHQRFTAPPKIARGENYLGMPWRMLDFPRIFGKADTFALRTFFWWGNHISLTLQLSGSFANHYRQRINDFFKKLPPGWYIGVNTDPWHHHFEADNYKKAENFSEMEFAQLLRAIPHIKLAYAIPVNKWNEAELLLQQEIKTVGEMLYQLPNR